MLRLFVRRYSISEDLIMFDITKVNAVAFAGRSDAEIAAEIGIRLAVLDDYNDYREKHCPSLTFIGSDYVYSANQPCWDKFVKTFNEFKTKEVQRKRQRKVVCWTWGSVIAATAVAAVVIIAKSK